MDKKEFIITIAKEMLTAYKPELTGATGENKVDTIGKYLSKVVKEVEKIYNEIPAYPFRGVKKRKNKNFLKFFYV